MQNALQTKMQVVDQERMQKSEEAQAEQKTE
jgi:hypothetical protein